VLLYAARFLLLALVAFAMSALLLPGFDIIVIGAWAGPSVFVLIAAQILVFGALAALLSAFTRADAWAALFLGIVAIIWDALRRAELLRDAPAGLRETVSVLLPPHGALARIELAYGSLQPVPWDAFLYIALYAALLLLLAGLATTSREI
jgi:hypothetical protein